MWKIVRFIVTGSWHEHKWKIIRTGTRSVDNEVVGSYYDLQCEVCGKVKCTEA